MSPEKLIARRLIYLCFSFCQILAFTSPHARASDQSNLQQTAETLAHYTNLEPAGSKGLYGASFGLAALTPQKYQRDENVSYHFADSGSRNVESLNLSSTKLMLTKGTPFPVDFGFVLAEIGDGLATTAGLHAQVNVFEQFRLPSFSLRSSYNKIFGLRDIRVNSFQIDLLGSYAVTNYLGFSISVGKQWLDLQRQDPGREQLFVASGDRRLQSSAESTKWQTSALSVGLRFLALPPNLVLAGEYSLWNQSKNASVAAKVSLEI